MMRFIWIRHGLLLISMIWSFVGCSQTSEYLELSEEDYGTILNEIDTLETLNNYHILASVGFSSQTVILEIRINERLACSMFDNLGKKVCKHFRRKEGYVFVYEEKECFQSVPKGLFWEDNDQDDYDYLDKSPFFKEGGFRETLLVEKNEDNKLLLWRIERLNEESFMIDEGDF